MLNHYGRCIIIFIPKQIKYKFFGDDWYKEMGRQVLHAYILNIKFVHTF